MECALCLMPAEKFGLVWLMHNHAVLQYQELYLQLFHAEMRLTSYTYVNILTVFYNDGLMGRGGEGHGLVGRGMAWLGGAWPGGKGHGLMGRGGEGHGLVGRGMAWLSLGSL